VEIKGSLADGVQRGSAARLTAVCHHCVPYHVPFIQGSFEEMEVSLGPL